MKSYCILFFICWSFLTIAQEQLDTRVDFVEEGITVLTALEKIASQTGLTLVYSNRFFDQRSLVNLKLKQEKVSTVLKLVLQRTGISYQLEDDQLIFYRTSPPEETVTLSGYIEDQSSGEKLIAAHIYCPQYQKGTYTNEYGFFSLTLPAGETEILVSYLNGRELRRILQLFEDQQMSLSLKSGVDLEAVVVTDKKATIQSAIEQNLSSEEIQPSTINSAPTLVGEADVLRAAQQTAGVQNGVDGFGGMFVRGGNNDQNLMLLDGVTIYNANHLFEFFSIYNATAIRSAKLVKGGYAARYGGRLSSVFDVRTREGNQKEWTGELGIGLISGKVSIEGPIAKGKGAILLTGRHSMFGFLMRQISQQALSDARSGVNSYRFADLNGKLNFSLSNKDRLFISYYSGGDRYNHTFEKPDDDFFSNQFSNDVNWGNQIFALRWNRQISNKLFLNTTFSQSRYRFTNAFINQETFSLLLNPTLNFGEIFSEIKDVTFSMDMDIHPSPKHYIHIGASVVRHNFGSTIKNIDQINIDSVGISLDTIDIDAFRALYEVPVLSLDEASLSIEDEWRLHRDWRCRLGLRISAFRGTDRTFVFAEPRFSLHYASSQRNAFHVNFSRMVQYLHLVNLLSVGTLDDIWVAASDQNRPAEAWQGAFGFNHNGSLGWSISSEVYYKRMYNLLAAPRSIIEQGGNFNSALVSGDGEAYGWEINVEKKGPRFTSAINYTLAWSKRNFPDLNQEIIVDAQYDRRHQINIYSAYQIKPWLQLSANWVYGSAYPILGVEPDNIITLSPQQNPPVSGRKRLRSLPVHRLDIGLNMTFITKEVQHQIKFGVYNVYDQANPAFHRLRIPNANEREWEPVNLIRRLPSFYYSINF